MAPASGRFPARQDAADARQEPDADLSRGRDARLRFRAAGLVLLLLADPAAAQQPTPLLNPPPATVPPAATEPPPPTQAGRDFCGQTVTAEPADPATVAAQYRQFVGIFSDAAWNPQLCAALIVETVAGDGTATITYVFGPLVPDGKAPGGVLHGTGIVKDGALLFQNNDGSQYAFRPFYSDLAGRWTNPQGQTYEAIFKRTF